MLSRVKSVELCRLLSMCKVIKWLTCGNQNMTTAEKSQMTPMDPRDAPCHARRWMLSVINRWRLSVHYRQHSATLDMSWQNFSRICLKVAEGVTIISDVKQGRISRKNPMCRKVTWSMLLFWSCDRQMNGQTNTWRQLISHKHSVMQVLQPISCFYTSFLQHAISQLLWSVHTSNMLMQQSKATSYKKPRCCWHGRPYCPSRKTNQTKDCHTFRNWSGSRPGSWTTVPQSINWPVPTAGHVAMHALWSRVKFIARKQLNATVHMQSYGRRLLQFGTQALSHK